MASRSSAQRNAASVLPEPVGATTSACRPAWAAAQAPSWAAVGATKAPLNQSRVAGEKPSIALTGAIMRRGSDSFVFAGSGPAVGRVQNVANLAPVGLPSYAATTRRVAQRA